MVNADVYA